ncbi:hypothetical protein RR48_10912 [Papilio machaon]|uniref:Uncharacterized protein n=1 Tax=Papilio machaon TaxID=76193 RepID=A0A194R7C5_PAPMA|nr:hypothetical protein RR48_10912 [Papilio machaon]
MRSHRGKYTTCIHKVAAAGLVTSFTPGTDWGTRQRRPSPDTSIYLRPVGIECGTCRCRAAIDAIILLSVNKRHNDVKGAACPNMSVRTGDGCISSRAADRRNSGGDDGLRR